MIAVGLTLGVAALMVALQLGSSDFGDPGSMGTTPTASVPSSGPPPTAPATTTSTGPEPARQPNPRSVLGDTEPGLPAPIRLRIPTLGVDAPIEGYGVNRGTGQMDIPDNATDVAWYRHGPAPGEPGSAVLAAHVDVSGQGPGVFFDLDDLEAGDEIVVSYEDRSERRFVVSARQTFLKTELPVEDIFDREGPPLLTLVTCGGGFSASTRSYDSNVVVYSVPMESTGARQPGTASGQSDEPRARMFPSESLNHAVFSPSGDTRTPSTVRKSSPKS